MIAKYAPEWPLDQVAVIDRNILRLAFWEFAVQRDTPIKVAINEAVELAKQFGSDSAPRFVNGVLGSLAEHKDEIRQRVENWRASNMEFLGVGPTEFLFIIIITLIVIGPKDMAKTGSTIGKWLNSIVQSDVWKVAQKTSKELRQLPTQSHARSQSGEIQD